MRLLIVLASVVVLGLPATRAQAQRSAEHAAAEARRDSLEAEVMQSLMRRLSHDLRLDASQRKQVEAIMRAGADRRRDLARASGMLRRNLQRALRDDDTDDAAFLRLLAQHDSLRAREHDLWRRDQAELAAVLSPRQRADFILSWTSFQETLQEIVRRRSREENLHPQH
jgi:Spy/CpxP family protein refolding chaperone